MAAAASIINRADPDVRISCVDFARDLGVAFQIIDDIHNFSRSPKWRKEPAEDISEGKITYVIHQAMLSLNKSSSRRLQEILADPHLRSRPEFREEAAELVRESQVFETCRQTAASFLESAWGYLSAHLEPSLSKINLRTMCWKLINADTEKKE